MLKANSQSSTRRKSSCPRFYSIQHVSRCLKTGKYFPNGSIRKKTHTNKGLLLFRIKNVHHHGCGILARNVQSAKSDKTVHVWEALSSFLLNKYSMTAPWWWMLAATDNKWSSVQLSQGRLQLEQSGFISPVRLNIEQQKAASGRLSRGGGWEWVTLGLDKEATRMGRENKEEKEPKIWGSRCGCAPISPRALETLQWTLWTKGSTEVYPTVSKTAGHLVERASRRKTKKILSLMSILRTYVSSERQMFLCVGSPRVGPHQKHWGKRIYRCSEGGHTGNVWDKGVNAKYRQVQISVAEL